MKKGELVVNIGDTCSDMTIGKVYEISKDHSTPGLLFTINNSGIGIVSFVSLFRSATNEEKLAYYNDRLDENIVERRILEVKIKDLEPTYKVGDRFRFKGFTFKGMEFILSKINNLWYLIITKYDKNESYVGSPWYHRGAINPKDAFFGQESDMELILT